MYCNKVKKGKHCITYMVQLNLTKLNLDRSSSVRRIFQSSVVKTLPCSSCFTACVSAHFPVVKLGYADRMTHCGMVPNGVADSIEFQLASLRGLKCQHLVLIPTSTTAYFGKILVIREMESVMIFQFVTVLKGINFASVNSI